jgi:hypothetical protein
MKDEKKNEEKIEDIDLEDIKKSGQEEPESVGKVAVDHVATDPTLVTMTVLFSTAGGVILGSLLGAGLGYALGSTKAKILARRRYLSGWRAIHAGTFLDDKTGREVLQITFRNGTTQFLANRKKEES